MSSTSCNFSKYAPNVAARVLSNNADLRLGFSYVDPLNFRFASLVPKLENNLLSFSDKLEIMNIVKRDYRTEIFIKDFYIAAPKSEDRNKKWFGPFIYAYIWEDQTDEILCSYGDPDITYFLLSEDTSL